ncbi:MAG TPA: glycosyltransferase family 1 protein [Candidatus Omnitrophica bacterium]|nr:glycosyltransferase family 1 protein [Candidatus Omnitrophota bacterium]
MRKRVKIAHIITRLIVGGAQENTILTVERLKKIPDYEVVLITGPPLGPEGSLIEDARKRGIEPVMVESLRRDIYPWLDFKSFFALYSLIRKGSYHIVHTHSTKAGILGRMAAHLAGVPVIVHTIHGLPFFPYQNRFMNFAAVNLERLLGPFTDKIITVCDRMLQKAYRAKVASLEKFITIYSGMELDEFLSTTEAESLKRELKIGEGELIVGKIARLFELKGHRFLLKSAKEVISKVPNVKFLFIGDGILKDELKKQASSLGIENHVIFTGLVPPNRIPEYLSIMDVVVHTSLREGLARVIPQAFASSKPIVSFTIDGAEEIIEDGKNGFLIPPPIVSEQNWELYNSQELTSTILRLLTNKDLRKRMGQEGKKTVDPIFRDDYMVERIDEVYRELLKEKRIIS